MHQPWATLIAHGKKAHETRGWATTHRGPIAIHAAKRWTKEQAQLCYERHFFEALSGAGVRLPAWRNRADLPIFLPLGAVVGVASLTSCRAIAGPGGATGLRPDTLPDAERAFGDYSPGRYAWGMGGAVALATPVECAGRQQLFDLPDDVAAIVEAAMGRRGADKLTADELRRIASRLGGTRANVHQLCEEQYCCVVDDDIFDRLRAEHGLRRCESCSTWSREEHDGICEDCLDREGGGDADD